jgi:hypothetical protein
MNVLKKVFITVKERIKGCDIYGHPVGLNFNGEDTFKTAIGGIATLVVYGMILAYTVLQAKLVIEKKNTVINTNQLQRFLGDDSTAYSVAQNDFLISISGYDSDDAFYFNQSAYFTLQLIHHTTIRDVIGTDPSSEIKRELNTQFWGTEFEKYIKPEYVKSLYLDKFFCPIEKDYTIGGNHMSLIQNRLEFRLTKCQGQAYCKTDAEINAVMDKVEFVIGTTSFFFNVNDYDDPLVVAVENDFNWKLMQGHQIHKILKLQINEAQDYTSILFPSDKKDYTYYSIDRVLDRTEAESEGIVMRIFLELDYKYQYTERKVYNFYDMLGQVGGVMGIIIPVGALVANIFTSTIYKMTLLSFLYRVENKQDALQDKKNYWNKVSSSSVVREESKISQNHDSYMKNIADGNEGEDMLYQRIWDTINQQERYKFKWKNLWYTVFCCPKFKCRKKKSALGWSYEQFSDGETLLNKELGLLNILDSARKTNILCKNILKRHDQLLLSLQRI